jgi:hypothetical protein
MRELQLRKQNLRFKLRHLEERLNDHAQEAMHDFSGYIKKVAFQTGLKIALSLFFRKRKHWEKTEKETELTD